MSLVKICGLTELAGFEAAAAGGADFAGLVFYPPSPRYLAPEQAAALAPQIPKQLKLTALFVDPTDAQLELAFDALCFDVIQLHGDETPDRVAAIRADYNVPVIKALRIGGAKDLGQAALYNEVADWLLLDSRTESARGGTGTAFDWDLLAGFRPALPWMLSGGLHPGNVAAALAAAAPDALDVSSGVESAPGLKCPQKIHEFVKAAKKPFNPQPDHGTTSHE